MKALKVNEPTQLALERDRRYRVADTLTTAHSLLRDHYVRRAILLDLIVLFSSIVIAALAFVDPKLLLWLPWSSDSSRIAIGVLAIVAFFASIFAWRVDWKGRADAHDRAASAYAKAKFGLDTIHPEMDGQDVARVFLQFEEIGTNSIKVPESKFVSLKSRHLLKKQLSHILDRNPAASVRLVKLRLFVRHTLRALRQNLD